MRPMEIHIPENEFSIRAVRSQGAGGQNVNKVATAAQLRFDVLHSSLPPEIKKRLLSMTDRRISADGVITIKAQQFRTQERNRADAIARLQAMVARAATVPKTRRPTKPSRAAREKRLVQKHRRAGIKAKRRSIQDD